MAFQTLLTIKDALAHIEQHAYVLPSIQREFVWKPDQIVNLLDSLMRGYPVGSFLFWNVDADNSKKFRFYDFVRNYHERDAPHCPPHDLTTERTLTAVLDGQQRLTSLNVAFCGSMTVRQKHKWKNNPDAYRKKFLYLNLSRPADDEGEAGRQFDFRFLTDADAEQQGDLFYPLRNIPDVEDATELHDFLLEHDLDKATMKQAFQSLTKLHKLYHDDAVISHYLETDQALDRVLNIFIRVNSGATKLSYSDLLMSIAAAQWSGEDARELVHGLVDELNAIGDGFDFSKDFVLKAGLMLSDIASVGFKVDNFNAGNMAKLRHNWEAVGHALKTTVLLAGRLGLNGKSLTADSALLPIAYHVLKRGVGSDLVTSNKHLDERDAIASFLRRSLLKSGVWGAGLDTTLTALRETLRQHAGQPFPLEAVEKTMRERGRSHFPPEWGATAA